MMNYFNILLFTTALMGQFNEVEVILDHTQIRESDKYLLDSFSSNIEKYYTTNIFSEESADLDIYLQIHFIIQSITSKSTEKIITAQALFTNQKDVYFLDKSIMFPYSKGRSLFFNNNFDPLASLLDYYAFLFIGMELDSWESLSGESHYVKAEDLSLQGKYDNYSSGWTSRFKKIKNTRDNIYLRMLRYNFFAAYDIVNHKEWDKKKDRNRIIDYINICYENLQSINNVYGNDRNTMLFLNGYKNEITSLASLFNQKHIIDFLIDYDSKNKEAYQNYK